MTTIASGGRRRLAALVPWQQGRARPLGVIVTDDGALLRSGIARPLDGHGQAVLAEAGEATN